METNIITEIVMNKPPLNDGVVTAQMLIGLLGPLVSAIAVFFSALAARYSSRTADEAGKIHVAVNSERTATLQLVASLREDILKLTKDNTILEETAKRKKR